MKDKIFGVLQRVGRSFMLPIALLPVAGLLLGLGSSFTNTTMLETYNLMGIMGPGTIIYSILSVMSAAGNSVFANLPLIFAMGGYWYGEERKRSCGISSGYFLYNYAYIYKYNASYRRKRRNCTGIL